MSNYPSGSTLGVITLAMMLLTGCKIDRNREIDHEKFTFKASDDTELFFKNVRQVYYDYVNK
jgi:hypothetical protein